MFEPLCYIGCVHMGVYTVDNYTLIFMNTYARSVNYVLILSGTEEENMTFY